MKRHLLFGFLLIAVVMNPEPAFGQAAGYSFTHLAGSLGGLGSADGIGSAARFYNPYGVAVDALGSLYVADTFNHTIRKVTSAGAVSTLAGLAGIPGNADGTGSAARFNEPRGVAVDGSGNVYVADANNHTIRKVSPAGVVSTLAGLAGSKGSADGTGSAARFNFPLGVAVDGLGNVYAADYYNGAIRKITQSGVVSTLARFGGPSGVAVNSSGNVYVADLGTYTIHKVSPAGVDSTLAGLAFTPGSADGTGSAARFNQPVGVAVDGSGNVFVADTGNHTIRKVTPAGVVSTLAGLAGSIDSADGTGSTARFNSPESVAVDGSGNVFVADTFNFIIRKVTLAGVVSTFAGLATSIGTADDIGSAARFNRPDGVAVDGSGNVYVADTHNHTIRKVTAVGAVSTLAGLAGTPGSADGTGSAARFNNPRGVAVDSSGNVYVADSGNSTIRKVTPVGAVSIYAGLAGSPGTADGTGSSARFNQPVGVAVDGSGNVYVADTGNNTIRKMTAAGAVSTLAGLAGTPGSADGTGGDAQFHEPAGVAVDGSGNVYVADFGNSTIRKVTPVGAVSTYAGLAGSPGSADGTGSAARFDYPQGVAVDGFGNVYVADPYNYTIRRVIPAGVTSTLGGLAGTPGSEDGTGSAARFSYPASVAVDGSGNVYVADVGNSAISKGTPPISVGFVPIVLDVEGLAHYTSELQLTNLGVSSAIVKLSYTGSIGSGSGDVLETIPSGQQVVYPDAISYLRLRGVPIPASGSQGGTLLFSAPAAGIHATVRTGADTVAPQPTGRSGLAYTDTHPAASSSTTKIYVYGLRTSDADRSNLAVYNMGQDPVSLKVTVISGDDGRSFEVTAGVPLVLPAYGWFQYSGVLNAAGFSSGYAIIERVTGSGPFGAYGVVNDQKTNDGSFIPAQPGTLSGSKLTIPVLVETGAFESELILTNRGAATATFTLQYFESLSPAKGSGGTATVDVAAGRQMIIPKAIDFLRSKGISIGARGETGYGGILQVQVSGVGLENVFAGARTSSLSSAGGEYGVFYPAVSSNQAFSDSAFVLGLKADAYDRSNVAVLHTGDGISGPITLELQVLDGSEGGKAVGQPISVTLNPGQWAQPSGFFASGGVPNGYVRIRRTAGTAPWYAYGVINDGGSPGQRTGDGSYVPGVTP